MNILFFQWFIVSIMLLNLQKLLNSNCDANLARLDDFVVIAIKSRKLAWREIQIDFMTIVETSKHNQHFINFISWKMPFPDES